MVDDCPGSLVPLEATVVVAAVTSLEGRLVPCPGLSEGYTGWREDFQNLQLFHKT